MTVHTPSCANPRDQSVTVEHLEEPAAPVERDELAEKSLDKILCVRACVDRNCETDISNEIDRLSARE